MGKHIDLTGRRFGNLVVIHRAVNAKRNKAQWLCLCDCGIKTIVRGDSIKNGHTVSCGCVLRKKATERVVAMNTTHGKTNTRLYTIWSNMKARCQNPNAMFFNDYGGRGIFVCKAWIDDFAAFYTWATLNGYQERLTIDRVNNNDGYHPDNCRWTDRSTQANNTRKNRMYTLEGIEKSLSEWCQAKDIKVGTAWARIERGWTIEEALSVTPKRKATHARP